ncbi:MAG: hypothetical protein ACI9KN_002489, partial [Gammaproteobacteria bacterium]
MSTHIDLVLPGLFNVPLHEIDADFLSNQLPALNQLLTYANPTPNNHYEFEAILADCIGLDGYQTLPFAQAYVDEATDDKHRYLLCRAIHLKADMHNALVIPLPNNSVNRDDAELMLEDLQAFFSDDCDLSRVDDDLWLMRLKQCEPSDCYPHYLSVIGRKANQFIEQSRQALPWYKLMNEMQMFMHQHDINKNRLLTGLLPLNSLWFWGAGQLPPLDKTNNKETQWFCDDKQLTRYAYSTGIRNLAIDQLAETKSGAHSLVIDLTLLEALKSATGEPLQPRLEALEETVFKPA